MMDGRTRTFRFSGNECPNGKKGDSLKLRLTNEQQEIEELCVEVMGRESYPGGYSLDCKMTDTSGVHYRVEVCVYYGMPWLGGAKVIYDMARNT